MITGLFTESGVVSRGASRSRKRDRAIDECKAVLACLQHELPPGHPAWTASRETAAAFFVNFPGEEEVLLDLWTAWRESIRLWEARDTRDLPAAIEAYLLAIDRLRRRLPPGQPPFTASVRERPRFYGGMPCRLFNIWTACRAAEGLRPFRPAPSEQPSGEPA